MNRYSSVKKIPDIYLALSSHLVSNVKRLERHPRDQNRGTGFSWIRESRNTSTVRNNLLPWAVIGTECRHGWFLKDTSRGISTSRDAQMQLHGQVT